MRNNFVHETNSKKLCDLSNLQTAPYPTEDSWSKQGNPRNYQQGRSWSSFLRYAPRTLQTLVLNDNEPLQEVVPNHQVGGW
jgi:hypothetical protein